MFSRRLRWLRLASSLLASFGFGYLCGAYVTLDSDGGGEDNSEIRYSTGSFTRPLLDCEIGGYAKNFGTPLSFHVELEEYVQTIEKRPGIHKVAVYFRDLDNGPWIGYREKERFTPASLYKIPIAVACLKLAVENPEFMQMRAVFPGLPIPELSQYHYPPKEELVKGREYAVWELLQRMLKYSDNAAAWMLTKIVGDKAVDVVFADLGVSIDAKEGEASTMSPEEFGRFFRVFYNASYLPPPVSEGILEVLTQNTFTDGLIGGLPRDVAVAHKQGEKMKQDNGAQLIQLHDAGIIYHPIRPYLLCVMTIGTSYEGQARAIQDVSRFTFDEVTRRTRTD